MPEQIRTFIAIELDEAQCRALGDVQARLKQERAAHCVRWVAPENIHLTLKFLGAVAVEKISSVQQAVADACADIPPFTLSLGGVGAFPNTRRPNVIWVGIGGQVETAARLAQKIDDACAALGFTREERAFAPHLTLGRIKRDTPSSGQRLIGEMVDNAKVAELGEFRVDHIGVMKSELGPGGSVYTRLYDVRLVTKDERTS